MTDIAARLRDIYATHPMVMEAATEVERLRAWAEDEQRGRHKAEEDRMNARSDVERLTNAIRRIDGINDNPADYNPAINAVCDAILREPKPAS